MNPTPFEELPQYEDYFNFVPALIGIYAVMLCVVTVMLVLRFIAFWRIYKKFGRPGWAAIVPFYNRYVLFDITFGKGIYFLFTFIPIVGVVFTVITNYKLCRKLGKGIGFFIGTLLLPEIFYLILAFDGSRPVDAAAAE